MEFTKRIRKIILIIFLGILCIPGLRAFTYFIPTKELKGAFTVQERPKFNWDDYFNSNFQIAYNNYFEDHLGFREVFIRLFNSISFTIFNKSNVSDVIVGKNNYLFNPEYINALNGSNFIGREEIMKNSMELKVLQDSLASRNKLLIVVFAPGKASYYKEFIPERFLKKSNPTNYELYTKFFDSLDVNFIDFKKQFISLKKQSKYPLFTRLGTHWTLFGASIAIDSINNYIRQKTKFSIPQKKYIDFKLSTQKDEVDYDLELLMNLAHNLPNQDNIYVPVLSFDTTVHHDAKPSVMFVSDSYFWNINATNSPQMQYKSYLYYFYFNTLYYNNCVESKPRTQTDVYQNILNSDVIVLMCTEGNDDYIPFGFTNYALATLQPEYVNLDADDRIYFIKKYEILNNPKWMKDIEKKAKENKITLEEQLDRDVDWALNH